jgi:hypothetical protein
MPLRQALKTHNLLASAARTTSSNAAALLPELVYDSNALTFKVACTAASGTTPTLDLYLQTTIDGGTNWLDCGHFAQITAAATHFMTIPITNATGVLNSSPSDAGLGAGLANGLPILDRNFRLKWVIGGTTPSFTFSVDLLANNQQAGR